MNDEQAIDTAKKLIEWARERWGVETEVVYNCPLDDYCHSDYEGYCPNDGRKLKKVTLESQTQAWRNNLEDFMYDPDEYSIAPPITPNRNKD